MGDDDSVDDKTAVDASWDSAIEEGAKEKEAWLL